MDDEMEGDFGALENGLNEQELKLILCGKQLKRTLVDPEEHFRSLLNPGDSYEPEPKYK